MDLPHRSKPSVTYGVDTEVAGKLGGKDGFDLLERGYRAWFPRRSADRDVSDGNFWGVYMRFSLCEDKEEENKDGGEKAGKGRRRRRRRRSWCRCGGFMRYSVSS